MVWRASVVAVAAGLLAQAQAFEVTLVNSCSETINVFDSKTTQTLQVGGTSTRTVSPGGAFVYRKGTGAQATLAEFSADNSAAWYDISIIPTGVGKGPGNCASLEQCMAVTGGVGFNVAMSIEPSQPDGQRCVALTCMADGCSDAYQYPADDTKTHSCPSSVDFVVTFCPGGSGGAVQQVVDQVANEAQNDLQYVAPTKAPTEAPTEAPTTQPPTPPPTEAPTLAPTEAPTLPPTEAPTQPPTEAPTIAPTEAATQPPTEPPMASSASASASVSSDADAGASASASMWNDTVGKVGTHNETSSSGSSDVDVGGDSDSESSGEWTPQTSAAPTPISDDKAGVQTAVPLAVQASSNDGPVEQATTKSSGGSGGGAAYIVLSIGAAVGLVAVAAIVVLRRKKQALDDMDSKTPAQSTDHNALTTATNTTSVVL